MRSRVLSVKDYREIPLTDLPVFVPDEEALEREMQRLVNPHIRWEPGQRAAKGDLVACRLESACPRFNKENVRFAAGSGMFHKELEALSIGMCVGETRELELPEGAVKLTVTAVTNRVVPEPSDEMAAALGLEGVSDLEEYRAYLLEQQREKFRNEAAYEPVAYLKKEVLRQSEFVLHKEDWRAAVERRLERCRTLFRQEGLVMEELTPEQFDGRIPVKSYHELVSMLQNDEWDSLLMYLLGRHYAESDGFSVSEEGYEAYIADYVKSWHTTPEAAREIDPYESYRFNEYSWHAYDVLQKYIKEQI